MLKLSNDVKWLRPAIGEFQQRLAAEFGDQVARAVVDEVEFFIEAGELRGVMWCCERVTSIGERASATGERVTAALMQRLSKRLVDKAGSLLVDLRAKVSAKERSGGMPS